MADHRPGRWALKDRRWPAVRLQALRRDGWRCVVCGSRHRLEVDHIEAVQKRPDLAFTVANLQTLCARHHTLKTRQERGLDRPDPEREKWQRILAATPRTVIT